MQFNCAKIKPNSPTIKALGTEKKKNKKMKWNPATWLFASYRQQYMHRSPRQSSETTSGWFLKVRSCLLVCSGIITLHCIVWAAILFPAHPYIESATALSDISLLGSAMSSMNITLCIITKIENMYAYYVSIDPRNDRPKDQTTLIEPVGGVVWGVRTRHTLYTPVCSTQCETYCICRHTQHTCICAI